MKTVARAARSGALALVVLTCSAHCALYQGPMSDHFDGSRFFNQPGVPERPSFWAAAKWGFSRKSGPWLDHPDALPGPPPPRRIEQGIHITFIGHATALIQQDGLNILTDPVWSERVGPSGLFSWAGAKRHRPPGIRFEDLPPIDVILLSHDHFDHLDLPTLRRLAKIHPAATLVAPLGHKAFLLENDVYLQIVELDWWESTPVGGVRVTATPAAHWSGRGPVANRALWSGFALSGPSGMTYYAGDTGWGAHFAQVRERLGVPQVALIPIGAYKPRSFMRAQHIDPAEALEAARLLEARTAIAVHFGTFSLADDGETEPVEELRRLLAAQPTPLDFWVLGEGEGRTLSPEVTDKT